MDALTGESGTELERVLAGERLDPPPVWLMRQAGRYLPEYRAVRATTTDFISFCFDPEKAAEVTLQPIRRYPGLGAAIVFADILLLPHVAGQTVRFVEGEGPVLEPLDLAGGAHRSLEWDRSEERLSPVYETLRRVRGALPERVALIGFAGSPWTVATYMLAGGKDPGRWAARMAAWGHPGAVDDLLGRLADAAAAFLVHQAGAGAQVLKLFDSWAAELPETLFDRVVVHPTRRVVDAVRSAGVRVPIIGFPRGSGDLLERYAGETGVTAVALDASQAHAGLVRRLPVGMPVQGGYDPALLRAGGSAMAGEASRLTALDPSRPYVFNLAHGVHLATPPEHVGALVDAVRGQGAR